jgi:hypothetical protein
MVIATVTEAQARQYEKTEMLVTQKPKGSPYLGRFAQSQEPPDEDDEVKKLREDILKRRDTSLPSD